MCQSLKKVLIALTLLTFLLSCFAVAQSTTTDSAKRKIKFLAPTIDGPTGFFGLYSAENLRGGEFSLGFNYNNRDRDPGDIEIVTIPVTFTLGLHDRVEWYVVAETQRRVDSDGLRGYKRRTGSPLWPAQVKDGRQLVYNETPFMDVGWGDTWGYAQSGLKFNLMSETKGAPFGVALRANVRHPFSRKASKLVRGMSSGGTDWGLDLLASKWAGPVTLLANVGFMDVHNKRKTIQLQNELNWGLGLGVDLGTPRAQFIFEADGTTFWGDRSTTAAGPDLAGVVAVRPVLVNPVASFDLVAGLRFFPSNMFTFGGGYRYNARRIDEARYGFDATEPHGFVVQAALQRKINEPPTVECRPASPASVRPGQTATITVVANDPDGDDLTVEWSATGGRITGSGMTATWEASGVNPGTYTITAKVSDGKHTVTCSTDVTVTNQGPTIDCSPKSQTVEHTSSVTLRVTATDPDGDPLTFTWEIDGTRVAETGSSLVFGATGRVHKTYAVKVTTSDGRASATCTFDVVVRAAPVAPVNRPPTVDLTVSPKTVKGCQTVTATARASDPDGDRLTYTWSVDGRSVAGSGSSLTLNSCDYSTGSHSVTVRVSDGRADASDTDSFTKVVDENIVVAVPGLRIDNLAKAKLDDVALKLQSDSSLVATITGYTDGREAVRNGQVRADKAKAYLVQQHKIDPNRITTKNGGRDNPIGDNKTADGRKQNRRVEILLTSK